MNFWTIAVIILLALIGAVVIILVIAKLALSAQFNREVRELFSLSKDISDRKFDLSQIADLPEPVQRYFKHVLKDGQPYISCVRLKHDGQFKTALDKNWMNIEGEQYFTAGKPGFIWRGTTSMFTARDMYIADKGRLIVSLFSLYNVVDGTGDDFNEGELQRWVSESVWFPTNLLPGERITWSAIDERSAKLVFNYKTISFFYVVTFNEIGEITQMETERFMGDEGRNPWLCKMADYSKINGVVVPTEAEAIWNLKQGEFSYAKFEINEIEYNRPERF